MIGTFLVSLFSYLTNVAIRYLGNISDVGLYQGAASITTQSISVIIAVLASDFFPRIAALTNNKDELNNAVNLQLSIVLTLIMPIVSLLICFAPFIIRILLTESFLTITPLLQYMSLSLLFRGVWITMSYIILAHGDRKRYLIYDAIIGNGLNFLINILAYSIGGLYWLGFSYIISSICVCVILCVVVCRGCYIKISSSSFRFLFWQSFFL
jgi:hypothetical protein